MSYAAMKCSLVVVEGKWLCCILEREVVDYPRKVNLGPFLEKE
jgi:hypothetical protein